MARLYSRFRIAKWPVLRCEDLQNGQKNFRAANRDRPIGDASPAVLLWHMRSDVSSFENLTKGPWIEQIVSSYPTQRRELLENILAAPEQRERAPGMHSENGIYNLEKLSLAYEKRRTHIPARSRKYYSRSLLVSMSQNTKYLEKASFPLELKLGRNTENPIFLFENNEDRCDFDWS